MIIKKDPSTFLAYLEDSSNLGGGKADELYIPENEFEIRECLKEKNSQKIPVTIKGAGTGNSGGSVPSGGVILSTEKLNNILKTTKANEGGLIYTQAGVLIKDLKFHAHKEGLFYTYDPTEQNAFVGGTVSTNASGARSFKYGPTRKTVESLKMCMADGGIADIKRGESIARDGKLALKTTTREYIINVPTYKMPFTKSSAGYYASHGMDLIDLFIGQEGTLSVILEAVLKLMPLPEDIISCFVFFKMERDAYNFALKARDLSKGLSPGKDDEIDAMSIEYFDINALALLRENFPNVPEDRDACVFFEQGIKKASEAKVLDKWIKLITECKAKESETWVALNEKDREGLLKKRHFIGESMSEMVKLSGMPKVSTDLAVPQDRFGEMFDFYEYVLSHSDMKYFLFGHIGDNHLHMNILPRNKEQHQKAKEIALSFVKKSISLGGTVSAEHGIGKMRKEYLKMLYGEDGVRQMIDVKKTLDPNCILGRGNIFDI